MRETEFCYDSPNWKLVGTSSSLSVAQTDFFAGNVKGKTEHESREITWTSSTGLSSSQWYQYIVNYVNGKILNPNYHAVYELGTFQVKDLTELFPLHLNFIHFQDTYAKQAGIGGEYEEVWRINKKNHNCNRCCGSDLVSYPCNKEYVGNILFMGSGAVYV